MTANVLSREIRVFLSSTFRDMQVERDYLLKHVFPQIRQACVERGVGFTEIDLRWGVSEEESRNGRTVEICLAEIDRCREYPPFFLGFLGERYGWIPPRAKFEQYWRQASNSIYAQAIESALQQGISVTELEMRYGVLDRPEMAQSCAFFLRDPALTATLAAQGGSADFYDGDGAQLHALKARLRQSGRVLLDGYTDVAQFGEAVRALLLQALDERYPADATQDQVLRTQLSQAIFAASRRHAYVPLPAMREAVQAYVRARAAGTPLPPLLISGESGLGKSALMADAAQLLEGQAKVIDYYVGADGRRGLSNWLTYVLERLLPYQVEGEALPEETKARWEALPLWLARAQQTVGRQLVLLLDAINEMGDGDEAVERLGLLPCPVQVAVIASSTPTLADLAPHWQRLELTAPNKAQRRAIIEAYVANYSKALDPELVDRLADTSACSSPLYLRLLLEELRIRGRRTELRAHIDSMLSQQTPATLFAYCLSAWDADYQDAEHPRLASRLAALVACSRKGLSEYEIAELLATEADPRVAEGRPKLPAQRLSPLLASLRPFLLRHEGRETLMHLALQEGALTRHTEITERQVLIQYFKGESPHETTERVFQRLAILQEYAEPQTIQHRQALVKELSAPLRVVTVYQEDNRVLRNALQFLGANRIERTEAADLLENSWRSAAIGDTAGWPLYSKLNLFLRTNNYLRLGKAWAEADLRALRQRLPENHPDIGVALTNAAAQFMSLGRTQEAVTLAKEAVALLLKARPSKHSDIALALNNVGFIYESLGQTEMAAHALEEALVIWRDTLPRDDPRLAKALSNLAVCYISQGSPTKAEPLLREALAIHRASLPSGHPDIATSLNNLASLCKNPDMAEQLYKEALSIQRANLPPQHPDIARALNNLALVYRSWGRLTEAESLLQDALTIISLSLGPRHPHAAFILHNLAHIYKNQGHLTEAERLFREALALRESALPPGHPKIARSLKSLARLYISQGRLSEAEPLLKELLAHCETSIPRLTAAQDLAMLYRKQGRLAEAASLLEDALARAQVELPQQDT